MGEITWTTQVNPPGERITVIAEYVLNNLGVFVKRERRVPRKEPLHKLTGFRVGFEVIPGTDYRAAPQGRNAILWQKITSVQEPAPGYIRICGNQKDEIELVFEPEMREQVLGYVQSMRRSHPLNAAADYAAAAWICWRDDDEWDNPYAPLSEMIAAELQVERFIEPEVLAETELSGDLIAQATLVTNAEAAARPKFCANCGAKLYPDSRFCEKCGTQIIG